MLTPRNLKFKLGMMISHDQQMTPIDFRVKGSKVKVILTLQVKNGFRSKLRNTEALELQTWYDDWS
jgi:hypothetical protein